MESPSSGALQNIAKWAFSMFDDGRYKNIVVDLINSIETTQYDSIGKAGLLIWQSLSNEGVLHVFSTGHSHMIAEELFYRAGGLIQVNPIFDPNLMLHEGAIKSTALERLPGYAEALFDTVEFRKGEPIIIMSNSGINVVPIEMAVLAKKHGMKVIAVTSISISSMLEPRHPSGIKLMDVGDVVIDNCIKDGDAVLELPNMGQKVGAVSSIAAIYIAQKIVLGVINEFIKNDQVPPVFMSANIPGGDEHNAKLVKKYKKKIRNLY